MNEIEVWDELAQEFRYWNSDWDEFDRNKDSNKQKPIDIESFIETLRSKYKLEKK